VITTQLIIKIVLAILEYLGIAARRNERTDAEGAGHDQAELEAHREANRVSDAVRDGVGGLRHDLDAIKADPNNRRRQGGSVPRPSGD